jgi:hypothetical protein
MMQGGSFDAKAITPSRRIRRRRITDPAVSRPTMLQLFLPRSIPRITMLMVRSFLSETPTAYTDVGGRGGPSIKGGAEIGPNPTDRGKPGTKRHLVVDRRGTPLGVRLSPANRHDSLMLAPTLDAVPGVRHGRGLPRKRPDKLHADKAYDN